MNLQYYFLMNSNIPRIINALPKKIAPKINIAFMSEIGNKLILKEKNMEITILTIPKATDIIPKIVNLRKAKIIIPINNIIELVVKLTPPVVEYIPLNGE